MKKLLFLLSLATFVLAVSLPSTVQGQSVVHVAGVSVSNSSTKDTVTNTATKTQLFTLAKYWETVTIEADVDSLSGTIAGKIWITASVKGSRFKTISDTLTPINLNTQTYLFDVTNHRGYKYFKVNYTGAATMAAKLTSEARLTRQ